MDTAASVFLFVFVALIVVAMVYAAYRSRVTATALERESTVVPEAGAAQSGKEEAGEQGTEGGERVPHKDDPLLRLVVWVGYGLAVALLVTDPALLLMIAGGEEARSPGCMPVIGASFWQERPSLGQGTCSQLAISRLGWALVLSVAATVSLFTLARDADRAK